MIILYILVFSLLLLLLVFPKVKSNIFSTFIFISPLIHSVADTTTNFFDGLITPGFIRGILYLLILITFFGHLKLKDVSFWIYIFLFYLALLIPISSNPISTIDDYIKVFISMLMFPIGYYIINTERKLNKVIKYTFWGGSVIILQLIIAQIFKLGSSVYVDESFYLGGSIVQITYTLVLVVLISPIALNNLKNKQTLIFRYSVIIFSVILIFIALRRISIVALIGGGIIYLFTSSYRSRTLKYVLISFFIIAIGYPFYGDTLESRINARIQGATELAEENRVGETIAVFEEIRYGKIGDILFGKELFNSEEYFAYDARYFHVFGGGRQLHVDYNIILHGAGFVGLLIYIIIHLRLLFKIVNNRVNTFLLHEYKSVLYSIYFIAIFIPLSGSISVVGFRSITFLFLGSLLSIIENSKK